MEGPSSLDRPPISGAGTKMLIHPLACQMVDNPLGFAFKKAMKKNWKVLGKKKYIIYIWVLNQKYGKTPKSSIKT